MQTEPELVQAIGSIVALLVLGALTTWQTTRARRAIDAAGQKAGRAAANTEGTSNGFAIEVKNRLRRIERKQDENHRLILNHLEAHADNDVKGPWRTYPDDVDEKSGDDDPDT